MTSADRPALGHDLRLAIPVAVAWVTCGMLLGVPELLLPGAGVCALATGVSLLLLRGRRGTVGGVVALCAVATGIVLSAAAVSDGLRRPASVVAAAEDARHVSAQLTLSEAVVEAEQPTRFRAVLDRVRVGEANHEVGTAVTVFATVDRPGEVGDTVSASGTLAPTAPGDSSAFLLFAKGAAEVVPAVDGPVVWASDLRADFRAAVATLAQPGAGLLPGLAIGDTNAVEPELEESMRAASLTHLTAVSGANCAIVVGIVLGIGALLRWPRWARAVASLVTLVVFVLLVTPEPSVLRAAVMAVAVIVARLAGRGASGVPVLALAVLVLLAIDPWLARNFGFVLSALATAGLLVLAGPLAARLSRVLPKPLALLIAVPLAAQLACQPVIILLTPAIPVYGVVANMLAGPAAPMATVLGLLACLLLGPLPWLGDLLIRIAWLPSSWIAAVAAFFAGMPGSQLPWWEGAGGLALLSGFTVLGVGLVLARRRRGWALASACLLVVVTAAGMGQRLGSALALPSHWQFAACDVGQGDAVLLREGDTVMLVDTGADPVLLAECLTLLSVDHVDTLVLTHFDLDHVGGVPAVEGRVGTVLHGPPGGDADERMLAGLAAAGADLVRAERGYRGGLGDLEWTVLWPDRRAASAGNDASLVLAVSGEGCHCLSSVLLGDLGQEAQVRMLALNRGSLTRLGVVDVVKVAHHGSADQSPQLYRALAARLGTIGVGEGNSYGHPAPSILQALREAGTQVARTDRHGVILAWAADDGSVGVWRQRTGDDAVSPADARLACGGTSTRGCGSAARQRSRRRLRSTVAGRPAARGASKKAAVAITQLDWSRVRPAPVVLVSGTEGFLADRSIKLLRDMLKLEDPSLEVSDIDAGGYAPGELLTVASPSLFGEPRMIRVTGVEKCTDAFMQDALGYLESPADGTYLVLRHAGGVRGKKLLDAIRSGAGGGVEVVCTELKKESEKLDFVTAEFRSVGRRVTAGGIRALVSAFSDDISELASACQQLIADTGDEVTEATVEKYYSGRVETTAFKVADVAIAGRHGEALVMLRHALASGADPVPIVAAFAMKVRTMAKVSGARGGSGQLAQQLGMAPWQVDRAKRDLQGWTGAGLGRCIEVLAETDAAVKGAERDPVFALERMVGVIASRGV